MARPRSTAREELLAAVVQHVAQHGIGELSLRPLADAIGTSHRMLLFHFGAPLALNAYSRPSDNGTTMSGELSPSMSPTAGVARMR